MGACRLNPAAATVDSIVREYMAEHPEANPNAVMQTARALDANCSGVVHSCELGAVPFLGEGLPSEVRRFIQDRELRGLDRSGFDYRDEARSNMCDMLLSDARGLEPPPATGVRIGRRSLG